MFSGIVEEVGIVEFAEHQSGLSTFWIRSETCLQNTKRGDSLGVNGVCLTVCELRANYFMCQAILETTRLTNLGQLGRLSKVNLERSMTPSTRIGGHFVQGHVDGVTRITRVETEGASLKMWFRNPSFYPECIISKGYIAIDGMSLTLVDTAREGFSVCFIPHTQTNTIVQEYQVGASVNVEIDSITKTVAHLMNRRV